MRAINPWKSYHQTAMMTAPPGQVILMLYDGALRFLERALEGFGCADRTELTLTVHNNLQRARDIIRELNACLNLENGGDLAETLRRLYDYFEHRIHTSNIRKKREGIEEVIRHLSVLRDAWAAMLRGEGAAGLSEPVQARALVANSASY